MFLVETLTALFMVVAFLTGIALVIADQQARRAPAREESRAWRRPRL